MSHYKRGSRLARSRRAKCDCTFCKPLDVADQGSRLDMKEGLENYFNMAPWEREMGEGAEEPCSTPGCDCGNGPPA